MTFTAKRPPRPAYDHIRPVMGSRNLGKRVIQTNIKQTTPAPLPRRGTSPLRAFWLVAVGLFILACLAFGYLFRGAV